MFVSGWFPLPSLLSYESLVSAKENTDRKIKKKSDRTQTKLTKPHVQYNVKIITQ